MNIVAANKPPTRGADPDACDGQTLPLLKGVYQGVGRGFNALRPRREAGGVAGDDDPVLRDRYPRQAG